MDTTHRSGRRTRRGFSSNTPGRRRNTHTSSHHRSDRSRGPSRNSGGGRKGRVQPTFDPSQFINKNPIEAVPEVYSPTHTFGSFGLDSRIVRAVADRNISTPTPIQDQIIPIILEGRDVIGLAETGTGKTAAFLLPLIHKTLNEYSRQTLILTPTRELALQIEQELKQLTPHTRLYVTTCVGGTNINPQIRGLRQKNHFVIGTPGRILDLIERGNLRADKMTTVVLDEADRMLDMGFITDMRRILAAADGRTETLFFSATMTADAEKLVGDFMNDPVTVSVKKRDVTSSVEQDIVPFPHSSKYETLIELLAKDEFRRVIIFGSMKHSVEKLAKQLTHSGIVAESIHGNKSHGQRQRSLARFKSGNARVLVATDVAARGIHVDGVTHVINYDLPNTFEDYIHRIGRTGRGSARGKALTFVPATAAHNLS